MVLNGHGGGLKQTSTTRIDDVILAEIPSLGFVEVVAEQTA